MLGVLSITVPIYLVMAVGWLATRGGLFERAEMRLFGKYVINLALPALLQSARGIVRNPMIHGIALGFLFSLFGWRLPEPVAKAVNLVAKSTAALSLMVIGGSLVGLRARGMARDVGTIAAGKLLLHPLAVLLMVVLLPPMDRDLQTAVVVMAAVPMLGIYPILAQKHGHDSMAAAAQLGTTVLSFFTLTSLLWLLQQTGR